MEEEYPEFIIMPPTFQHCAATRKLRFFEKLTEPSLSEIKSKEILLGSKHKKLTLVLDIDNTILFSKPNQINSFGNKDSFDIILRPYLKLFLESVSPHYFF